MADTGKAFPMVKGQMLRATKVDACGNPVPGPFGQLVTKGFISVQITPETEAGNTITQTNANGETCLRDTALPEFQDFSVDLALCGVDPYLKNFLSGAPLVYDDATSPLAVGFDYGSDVDLSTVFFALELWSKIPGQQCVAGQQQWGYTLLPFLQAGSIDAFTIQNDAVNFTVSGAKTQDGNAWGVGPYNVDKTKTGVDSPLLTPIGTRKHIRVITVKKAPPVPTGVGAQPLGTLATTATAGIPGTYSPANSYAPANLAAIQAGGTTASPTTAWTTGQYVVLGDGSKANWSGTVWAAGPHA